MKLPKYTDRLIIKKRKKFISKREKAELIIVGLLLGAVIALFFLNYIISPAKFEVAMPMPSDSVGQDRNQGATGTQEAEFKNATQSSDWFYIPKDGASYVQ